MLLVIAMAAGGYARTAVSPLQESMRLALDLTDNQMALLQGPALGLPLLVVAVPLGLIIDRYSRTRLLLILIVINLVASTATAFAPTFTLLLVARCLVGLAAFATVPVVLSLLSDLSSPERRGRGTTAISLGQIGGNSAAFALGGMALAYYGAGEESWRHAMAVLIVPLVLAVFCMMAVREPPRTGVVIASPSPRESFVELWRYRAVVSPLLIGFILVEIAIGAELVWAAPALSRSFALESAQVGSILSMALLISGVVGAVAGGAFADFCESRGGPRRTLSVMSLLALLAVPAALFSIAPVAQLATTLLVLSLTITLATAVMAMALLTVVIPNELRGLCTTLSAAINVLFAVAAAPLMVSMLSGAMGGPGQIGKALAVVGAGTCLAAAVVFAFGSARLPVREAA